MLQLHIASPIFLHRECDITLVKFKNINLGGLICDGYVVHDNGSLLLLHLLINLLQNVVVDLVGQVPLLKMFSGFRSKFGVEDHESGP